MINTSEPKARPAPRLSVNQLAKYISAKDSLKRAKILDNNKNPDANLPTYLKTYYQLVEKPAQEYFASGFDESVLDAAISAIDARGDIIPDHKKTNSMKALEALKSIDVSNFTPKRNPKFAVQRLNSKTIIPFSEVEISARPELLVTGTIKGVKKTGAIKFYFSTSEELTHSGGEIVGVVNYLYLESEYPNEAIDERLVYAIDVFRGLVVPCPKSKARRTDLINATCVEVKSVWDNI